ncbi:MAG: hypothetical protein J3K34DRAFT_517040 [Monoraphidium minutum]|nr:MAG: hypothetical protein J3K34DRAFT_517040 [Monoraphidium minutum]
MSGLQTILLRQAGPALQQLLGAALYAGSTAAATVEGAAATRRRRQRHGKAAQHDQQEQQQQQHSRSVSTSAAPQAPRFHENLKVPRRHHLYTRENYKALRDAGWDLAAIRPLLEAAPPRPPPRGAAGAPAARAAAAAATRAIAQAVTLADLKAIIEASGHALDGVALAAAAARVPRAAAASGPGAAAGAERLLDRLLPPLLARVGAGGELGARELSNVLWALSKVGYPLEAAELERIIGALLPLLGGAAPRELSMAAVAAARLAPAHGALWGALAGPAAAALRGAAAAGRGGGGGGTAAAAAGADAAARGGRRARRHGAAEPAAPLYTGPHALAAAAAARDATPAGASAQAAANLAWAHARAGRAPPELVAALGEWLVAGGGAGHLNPAEISMLAWAAARWARGGGGGGGAEGGGGGAALPEAAVTALLDAAADKLWQFGAGELDGLVRSAGALGMQQHPPLLAALAKQLDNPEAAAAAAPATLAAALSAAARAGSDGGRALLAAAAAAVAADAGAFAPGDAASVVWAGAAMGLEDDAFYAAALTRLAACVGECGPREITHALLGACASRDAARRGAVVAAAAPAAAARAAEFAPRDAAAALRVLAAAAGHGELGGAAAAAAAEALGGSLLAQWRAGGVPRHEARDAAASLDALLGPGHAAAAALRGGGEQGEGDAPPAQGQQQ